MGAHDPTWNTYLAESWSRYLPPIRPAPEELEIFESVMIQEIANKGKNLLVAIMGSTPELRDLCALHSLNVTVVDYNGDNYRALSALMKYKGSEKFVNQNWLNLKVNQEFDIVLMEASCNVVAKSQLDRFFRRINTHLKPQGVVIAKTWVRVSNDPPSIEEIIHYYRSRLATKDFYSAMCLPLFLHFYDFQKEEVSVAKFSAKIEELYQMGVLTKQEWETIKRHNYEKVTLKLYIPQKMDFQEHASHYYRIEQVIEAGFDFSNLHPVFVMRSKQIER